jgi:O-antigen/teichoic acid export membrane protein
MRKILIINSLSGGLQLLFSSLLVLVTVPIFIQKLGIEKYGIFSLIIIINNFSFFFGLGINFGLVKFLSEQGKTKESNIDILTAYIFLIISIIPFTLVSLYFNNFILKNILNIPGRLLNEDIVWLFNFLIIANFFQFIGQIPTAILDSLQKIYLTNFLQTLHQIIYWSLILTSIFIFGSLKMIGVAILLSTIILFILLLKSSFKHWGAIQTHLLRKTDFIISIKKQSYYTFKIYLASLINFFYEPLTKVLIASFIGITEVGFFDIILRIRTQVWNLISKLLYPLYPFISQVKDKFLIRNIIHDSEQKLTYLVLFLIVISIFITPDFIDIWLKSDEETISNGLILLLTGNLIGIIAIPVYQFLVVKGYPGKTIIVQSLNVFVNLIVFLLLYKKIGFMAAIWGNISAILSSFSLCIYYQNKYLKSLIFDNFHQFLKSIIFFLLTFIICFFIDMILTNSLIEIFILPTVLFCFALFFIRLLKLITIEDISKYSGENKKIQKLLTKVFIIPSGNV